MPAHYSHKLHVVFICSLPNWECVLHSSLQPLCAICCRIGYYSLTQVAFGTNFFAFNYYSRDEDNNFVEKKMRVYVRNHTVARSIFRDVTEEQVFFYQNSVQPHVLDHADTRYRRVKRICEKVFRKKFETKYYYDIVRTKNEAYRHAWQQLHQFSDLTEPPPIPSHAPVIAVAS